jgi:hypothetical protein
MIEDDNGGHRIFDDNAVFGPNPEDAEILRRDERVFRAYTAAEGGYAVNHGDIDHLAQVC